ncbi:MAG: hypothetical protein HY718_09440 [Planctomycetes bacterium]|nr:hypothetical protein [Planctomycetota bacterium]
MIHKLLCRHGIASARSQRFVQERAVAVVFLACATLSAGEPSVTWYRLQSPGLDGEEIEQASDLCYGPLGEYRGLWTVCDRNGGRSAGRIYLFAPKALAAARAGGSITADHEFTVTPPPVGWSTFGRDHARLGPDVLNHIEERVAAGLTGGDGKRLDLEAVTIGVSSAAPHKPRLFVVAEEPYSLMLELEVRAGQGASASAELIAAYRYFERDEGHGADFNDGLEGLAYAGSPGEFWWAEEGTRLHQPNAHPRLFFSDPRVGRGELKEGALVVDQPISDALTGAVRERKDGAAQTLNALCVMKDGRLLAVDRNGGWVLLIDPVSRTAARWFNVYNVGGTNLREALAAFPGPRGMTYVSIEGIAVDDRGSVWLVDDPAMPEPFRASCLVRISGLPLPPEGDPASSRGTLVPGSAGTSPAAR